MSILLVCLHSRRHRFVFMEIIFTANITITVFGLRLVNVCALLAA